MVPPSIFGVFTHHMNGMRTGVKLIDYRVGGVVACGCALGGWGGAKIGQQIDEKCLRWGFACLMVVLGGRMVR